MPQCKMICIRPIIRRYWQENDDSELNIVRLLLYRLLGCWLDRSVSCPTMWERFLTVGDRLVVSIRTSSTSSVQASMFTCRAIHSRVHRRLVAMIDTYSVYACTPISEAEFGSRHATIASSKRFRQRFVLRKRGKKTMRC
jgi:hypothetical protein